MAIRSMLYGAVLVTLTVVLAGCGLIEYTGDTASRVADTRLCARTGAGSQVTFVGSNLFGVNRTTPPLAVNASSLVCTKVTWPMDIYTVIASAGLIDSPPSALTVFPLQDRTGVTAGGVLGLTQATVLPTSHVLNDWEATFGLFYWPDAVAVQTPGGDEPEWQVIARGAVERMLYHDPLNPAGAVRLASTEFVSVQALVGRVDDHAEILAIKISGYGPFTRNGTATKRFELELWKTPARLKLQVFDAAATVVYQAEALMTEGMVVFNF